MKYLYTLALGIVITPNEYIRLESVVSVIVRRKRSKGIGTVEATGLDVCKLMFEVSGRVPEILWDNGLVESITESKHAQ